MNFTNRTIVGEQNLCYDGADKENFIEREVSP